MSTEYEGISSEYYDARAHPTIALLRAGSRLALAALAPDLVLSGTLFAEVGSGQGMLREVVSPPARAVVFDLSVGMLQTTSGERIVGDATALPVAANTFDGILASLCDPYNTPNFLREARRVLKPGGRLLMTVPDHRWVRHNQAREGVRDAAVIVTRTGPITVPSFVHEPAEQVTLLKDSGFDEVRVSHTSLEAAVRAAHVTSARLLDDTGIPISDHITNAYLAW